jgi:dienelactone hydrolase
MELTSSPSPVSPVSQGLPRPPLRSGVALRARWARAFFALEVLAVLLAALLGPAAAHVRAMAVLLRGSEDHPQGLLAGWDRHAFDEEDASVPTAQGSARARLYVPRGVTNAPGVVLVHGVHRLGIDEPRLTRFARALASAGLVVLTPEVAEIADYRVDPRSIDTIGAAAVALAARTGRRAGVMGMSFAGGLGLMAAADPRFAPSMSFVAAIGAHGDLARVSRFFATNVVERPEGPPAHLQAHGYGVLVLVYGRAERFFPPEDVAAARDALRLWLGDDRAAARARAEDLSPESWARVTALFDDPVDFIAPEILAMVDDDAEAMKTVSPRGHLGQMVVPVFLLHGAGDTVIPAVETEWLAREVPPAMLRSALVSRAISHVELGSGATAAEQWAVVDWMAGVLEEAEMAATTTGRAGGLRLSPNGG